jgi:predicted DNA-binding ArsR family transcriptional regulator
MCTPFSCLLPDLGKLITVNRLSCVKHITNKSTKQEKNAFYRVFLHLIDALNCKQLFIKRIKTRSEY